MFLRRFGNLRVRKAGVLGIGEDSKRKENSGSGEAADEDSDSSDSDDESGDVRWDETPRDCHLSGEATLIATKHRNLRFKYGLGEKSRKQLATIERK